MNLQEYQKQTIRTFAFRKESLNTSTTDMLHCAIGVATEVSELVEAINKNDVVNIGEEIADQMWYVSNLANFIKLDMYKTFTLTQDTTKNKFNCVNTSCILSGELLDIFKKVIFYNKELDITKLQSLLFHITQNLYDLCCSLNLDFSKMLDNNINKLRVRFPDKFTDELAENRDLESERKELEK